ncbi:MAG: hypothetical protein ABIJ59_01920 [Pseudomonadota bacterium]
MENIKSKNPFSGQITVVGVGGAGGHIASKLMSEGLLDTVFIAIDTDICALEGVSKGFRRIPIGENLTHGLGSGANPQIGGDAALESIKEISKSLKNYTKVIIIAGLSGGTGTGAAPVIAQICRKLCISTIAVLSKPYYFEGERRNRQAREYLERIKGVVDTVITISNDRLLVGTAKNSTAKELFNRSDKAIIDIIKQIPELGVDEKFIKQLEGFLFRDSNHQKKGKKHLDTFINMPIYLFIAFRNKLKRKELKKALKHFLIQLNGKATIEPEEYVYIALILEALKTEWKHVKKYFEKAIGLKKNVDAAIYRTFFTSAEIYGLETEAKLIIEQIQIIFPEAYDSKF